MPLAPLRACLETRPAFRWRAPAGRGAGTIELYHRDTLLWAVAAEGKAPRPAFFTVLEEGEVRSVEDFLNRLSGMDLDPAVQRFYRAAFLASKGLLGEARPLLERLVREHRGGTAAALLLRSLEQASGE